jgi:nucleotide-binding universal stress UspA family protein
MSKPIVVAHDGTEMSDRALSRAVEFAKAFNSEIILVHIVDSRFVPPSTTLALISEKTGLEEAKMKLIRILKSGAQIIMKERIERTIKAGVSARFVIGVGSPAEEIVSIAKAERAEIIIIGSRRLGGDKMVTIGSVARRVSEIAPCPVLIVK